MKKSCEYHSGMWKQEKLLSSHITESIIILSSQKYMHINTLEEAFSWWLISLAEL